ncbi:MAG: efflux RND transporter periplasmic adaptor subunit [Panacagrimonas sp.]
MHRFKFFKSGALAALSGLMCACGETAAPIPPPPPEVQVFTVTQQPVGNLIELPGRVQAVRTAEVRARVDGIVERRLYKEGSDVVAGQDLFEIDPRQLRASLNAGQASLERAQATEASAKQDVARLEGLVAEQAVSQQEYDTAVARLRTAQADVSQSRAQLESARLNLSYTTVNAPIDGRAGRAQVTEGALVSASAGTLLTTIEQLDPIHVNFSQSSAALLEIRRDIASGTLKVPAPDKVEVRLVLEDGSDYELVGHLNFLDLAIDVATGTVALRAEIPNPRRFLLPGQFVRALIQAGVRPQGLTVPQRAVKIAQQGASVMVVDPNNVAMIRPVKVGDLQGDAWVILEGLKAGERVIVDGLQKVQPDKPVRITTSQPPAPAPPSRPATDSAR